jgi:chemotaxis protein CheZ
MDAMDPSPALHCDASGLSDGAAVAKKRKPRKKPAPSTASVAVADNASGPTVHGVVDAPVDAVADAAVDAAGASSAALPGDDGGMPAGEVYQRIGHLTRTLHDALRELGYDKELQGTRDQLPDARDRLTYIARVTGEAAEKVLNAVDRARVVQEQMTLKATDLRTRWMAVAAYAAADAARATPAGRTLIDETCAYFDGIGGQTDVTQAILTDIMMAQDFHDLTGQVIRKVVTLAQNMEEQLLKLLLETTPPEQRKKLEAAAAPGSTERLEGPVVKADGRDDVVTDQAGVDDLLASLGF